MSHEQRRLLPPNFLVDRTYPVTDPETGTKALVVEGVMCGHAALALIHSDNRVEVL